MEKFWEVLNKGLADKGLTEEQIKIIGEQVINANDESTKLAKEAQAAAAQSQNELLIGLVGQILEKPEFTKFLQPSGYKIIAKLIIVTLLIGSIISLAAMGVLGASETSTLLGGIVGYLLGNTAR